MKIYFDLHTHTIVSGHAYSTLSENVACAKKNGLLAYGHSEHAEKMPGSCHNIHFLNLRVIPREIDGVRILHGVEANIMDYDGNIDCNSHVLSKVDYAIASLHIPCIDPGTKEENTKALCGAMEIKKVKIIGHPDDSRYSFDYDVVCKKAKETGTLLEINNSSLDPRASREGGYDNIKRLLEKCMEHRTKVILGTDTHWCEQTGVFTEALKVIKEVGFDKELIVNESIEGLKYIIEE